MTKTHFFTYRLAQVKHISNHEIINIFIVYVYIINNIPLGYLMLCILLGNVMVGSHQPIKANETLSAEGILSDEYFGGSVAVSDINNDGSMDMIIGASGGDGIYILFLDTDMTCVSFQKITTADSTSSIFSSADAHSTAALGDLDGDSVNDVMIGTPFDYDGGSRAGAIYILFLAQNGTYTSYQKISDLDGDFTYDLAASEYFGSSCSLLGDLNGDSVVDIAVGAYGKDDGGYYYGAVYILFLKTDGNCLSAQKISSESGDFTSTSFTSYAYFGYSCGGLGDMNGDLTPDAVIGTPGEDEVYIVFLVPNGTVLSLQKIGSSSGGLTATLDDGDYFGAACNSAGDVNGDGLGDLMTGASLDDDGSTDSGALYILFLDQNGWTISHQKISAVEGDFTAELWSGNNNGAQFGSACVLGDMNGDGIPDLVVGAHATYDSGADENDLGTVYVIFISQSFGKNINILYIYIYNIS